MKEDRRADGIPWPAGQIEAVSSPEELEDAGHR